MAKKPLKSQLNQIRAWAREGRTDAWIAHQLDVSANELRGFRKRHGLTADDEAPAEDDLRDTIEAEIEAAALAEPEDEDLADEDEDEDEDLADEDEDFSSDDEDRDEDGGDEEDEDGGGDRNRDRDRDRNRGRGGRSSRNEGGDDADDDRPPRRRGRRRRGGGVKRAGVRMEASFDHGGDEGYGLWLDPAVAEDPVYTEHWKGHEAIEVTIEPDRIVIRRAGDGD